MSTVATGIWTLVAVCALAFVALILHAVGIVLHNRRELKRYMDRQEEIRKGITNSDGGAA